MPNQSVKVNAALTAKVKARIAEEKSYTKLLKEAQDLPEGVIENDYALSTVIDANEIVAMANDIETTIRKLREDYEQAIKDHDPSRIVCETGMLMWDEKLQLNTMKLGIEPKGDIIALVVNREGEDNVFDGQFNVRGSVVELDVGANWHLAQYTIKYLK